MKGIYSLVIVEIVLIILLFLHHYYIHGVFYNVEDFTNAVYYLFKSHEGLIILIAIIAFGVTLGASV